MSKAFFRFLRGELNGFYITNINNSLNEYSKDIKDFFKYFKNQQFDLEHITNETLYNLGKFASIQLPRRHTSETRSSIYMTDEHQVGNVEFSERGLYNIETEQFEFEHESEAITNPDINTLATEVRRSSLVGDEQIRGYISEDEVDVIDVNGNVRPEKVLSVPPEDKAYSNYYGNQFSFLAEGNLTWENISPPLFIELFKALQWVRYNGKSLKSLVRIIELVCPRGLVVITNVTSSRYNVYVHYRYDASVDVTSKESRLALLEYIVNLKFKQVVLTEEEEE